jgi:alkaline phosphatase D
LKRPDLNRRGALRTAAAALAAFPFLRLGAQTFANRNPFTLGVASGCPTPDGVVLWTRLAPEPLAADGGMGQTTVEVQWELAEDERFARIVRSGQAMAQADEAHTLHIELSGLAPARDYWYRFTAGGARSATGRTRTAPAEDDMRALRFAFCSCQQYEQGYYTAYRDMAAQHLDLVVHLGDYIYESSWGKQHVRRHGSAIPTTLPEYRTRYALYKTDADLQAAHAASPWLVVWDDHEVANDYTNDISPLLTDPAQFLAVRAAAYRAWWEHMPVPQRMRPQGAQARIHGRWRFGQQLDLFMLDGRQHRDHHVCLYSRNASPPVDCPDRLDPARSLLGAEQEAWLARELARPATRWTVLAQPTLMASVDRARDGEDSGYWMDGWDGYAATRDRVLAALQQHRPVNPLVLSGDVHAFWAADLARRPGAAPMATEFVGGSITSDGPSAATVHRLMARNPQLHYGRGDRRGYGLVTLDAGSAQLSLRSPRSVKLPDAPVDTLARFAVESGRAGVQIA